MSEFGRTMFVPPARRAAVDLRRRRQGWRVVLRYLEHAFAVVGILVTVYYFGFRYSVIVSESMSPTLQGSSAADGDRVITERCSYYLRDPRRWEVVTIVGEDGGEIMKRVVGLPGEQIQMLHGGQLLIDGRPVRPPPALDFLKYVAYGNLHADNRVPCGDEYFVLGDESLDSDDSRFQGTVPRQRIIGRPWLVVAPSGRRGWVQP